VNLSDLQTKLADQLYTCTDDYALPAAQPDFCCSAPASTPAAAGDATARSSTSWFPHRALQTLRQPGLQMRPRPRPRSQVLPLDQSLPTAAANGLHSPRLLPPDHGISGQLSAAPSALGRDLRHQSRAVIPPRGTLRNRHESCSAVSLGSLRCRTRQPAPRQHALRLARPRSRRAQGHGGRA
jgi:hypothetical protein